MKGKQLTMSFLGTVIRVAVLIIAVLLIYRAGLKAYDFGFRIFTEEPMSAAPGRDVDVMIAQGDGIGAISEMMEEKGLIRDAQLFSIQKRLSQYEGDIQPGTYTLNTSMTAEEMFAVLLKAEDAEGEGEELEAAPLEEADTAPQAAPLEDAVGTPEPTDTAEPAETAEPTDAAEPVEE